MDEFFSAVVWCAVGLGCWVAVTRMGAAMYSLASPEVQRRVYRIAKNFPSLAVGWGAFIALWTGIGALLLKLFLPVVGLAHLAPRADWAPFAVCIAAMQLLRCFWNSPEDVERIPERGRGLINPVKPQRTPAPSNGQRAPRGRTIRSYQDIH